MKRMPPSKLSVTKKLHRWSSTRRLLVLLFGCAGVAVLNFIFGGNQMSLGQFPRLMSDTWDAFSWNVQAVRTYSLEEINQILNLTDEADVDLDLQANFRLRKPNETTGDPRTTEINLSFFIGNASKCPPVPPNLMGFRKVDTSDISWEKVMALNADLEPGGRHKPRHCIARNKVAIIVPYRDREAHLRSFLHNLHPMLRRQELDYGIYVVDQTDKRPFNRAMLFNVGFLEARKLYDYDCFIFHDVDLIPEDDRNLYSCPLEPRHMSVAIDFHGYKLPYDKIFGGVSAMTTDQFLAVNGFSNKFWGWGGEDDEMSDRLKNAGFHISRYPLSIGRYTALKHAKAKPNPRRYHLLHAAKHRMSVDGVNSAKYEVVDVVLHKVYTTISVRLLPS